MKNAMQTKAIMKRMAKELNISAQLVLQNYMLERFLERLSVSRYQQNFIIKGGFLIAAMVGLESRATMDLDVTIKAVRLNEDTLKKMVEEIIRIDLQDDVHFSFLTIDKIREQDDYLGYRVALSANYPPMVVPIKLDITTGDKITPREIEYQYKLILEDRTIKVLAYNLASILAEKLETVISRGDQNTRPRDYYDIYMLTKLQAEKLNLSILASALEATTTKRASSAIIKQYRDILMLVRNSEAMNQQWVNYQNQFAYARNIKFSDTCNAVLHLMDSLQSVQEAW